MIPRHPSKITAKSLQDKLESENFSVSNRTVQRDLQSLSESFPILSDERDKPFGWSWSQGAKVFDVPGLSNTEALTFKLVEQYLKPLLPASTLAQLSPYFASAEQHLEALSDESPMHTWLDKARVVQPNQNLIAPNIDAEAQRVVYEALLQNRQVKIAYLKRGEKTPVEYTLHPLGIVQRGQIIYLVCTMFTYADVRLLAMHRVKEAEMLADAASQPEGFNLDAYIVGGAFGFGGNETIKLELRFYDGVGNHLYETPLSVDQTLTVDSDQTLRVTATIINTEQLRWWLLGFGGKVEVLSPEGLRAGIAQVAEEMINRYRLVGV
jgi:predicted DNA-binding transcriptional regulator YafY